MKLIINFIFIGLFSFGLNSQNIVLGDQSIGGLSLTEVAPRVITPNGDMLNDVVFFHFDNTLSGLPFETSIWDIHGAKVGNMALDNNETAFTWNGRDESGAVVPGGIYIYSIKLGKNYATGTVVVAR